MAPAPIDPRRFYLDFIAELNLRRWPIYPERKWWESLRFADIRDQFRSVARVNSVNDESYFERQRTYLLRQSDSAVDFQMPSPRIAENPAPRLVDNRGRSRPPAK